MRAALVALFTLLIGCSQHTESDFASGSHVTEPRTTTDDISVQEPRFVFVAPEGFRWNDQYRIWHNETTRTSVTLAHAQGPTFSAVVDEFVADRLLVSELKLTNKEMRDVDGRPTLLVNGIRLNAPYPQEFCTVAFGTSEGCAQITAIYPADGTDEMKKQIEASMLDAKYEVTD